MIGWNKQGEQYADEILKELGDDIEPLVLPSFRIERSRTLIVREQDDGEGGSIFFIDRLPE